MATRMEQRRRSERRRARKWLPADVIAVLMAATISVLADPAGGTGVGSEPAGDAEPASFFAIIEPAEIAELISEQSGVEAVPSAPKAPGQEPLVFSLHEPSGRHYYLISVAQGAGGALFDEALKNREIDAVPGPDASPEPSVFARVQNLPISAGPGGSTFGILFTTCDGRFDLRIIASQNLPEDFGGQSIDVDLLAYVIGSKYSRIFC